MYDSDKNRLGENQYKGNQHIFILSVVMCGCVGVTTYLVKQMSSNNEWLKASQY